MKNPLLILPATCAEFPECDVVALLGALEALYVVKIFLKCQKTFTLK